MLLFPLFSCLLTLYVHEHYCEMFHGTWNMSAFPFVYALVHQFFFLLCHPFRYAIYLVGLSTWLHFETNFKYRWDACAHIVQQRWIWSTIIESVCEQCCERFYISKCNPHWMEFFEYVSISCKLTISNMELQRFSPLCLDFIAFLWFPWESLNIYRARLLASLRCNFFFNPYCNHEHLNPVCYECKRFAKYFTIV